MSSIGEHAVDRLSSMPQDVLSNILSLMPIKSAVRTTLLSKTWRYTWTFVHNLDFDKIEDHELLYPKHVDWVLERCKTSEVKIFRVQFSYNSESYSEKMISKLIRLNVHELDMKSWYLRLPSSLYTCKTLTTLKLHCTRSSFPNCPYLVNLPNLKTLHIAINRENSESALKLIHGCPVLENLYVKMVYWTWNTYYFKISTLKRLNVKIKRVYSDVITGAVVLNLPNLEHFLFDGNMGIPFIIETMPSLIEAKVSYLVYHGDQLVQLLKVISQAKSISLNTKDSSRGYDHLDLPMFFPNLKQLELEGYVGHQWNVMPQFLERSPKLERLSIGTAFRYFRCNKPKSIPTCMRVNLKTVKYTNGCSCHDLEFLKFILSYSKVLKTVTVECDARSRMVLRANLTKLRRASIGGEIRLQLRPPTNKTRHFSANFCTTTLAVMNTVVELALPSYIYCSMFLHYLT